MKCILVLINILLTASCGWRHVNNNSHETRTLFIPYVVGDGDGQMTAELVQQIEQHTSFTYVPEGGELTLYVTLLDSRSDNIGFRYDPEKLKNGKHKTIPNEVRRQLLAKITLVENATQKTILGPAHILGSTEFDHQYYILDNDINTFSLGQLTDIDTAYDVVNIPLNRDLAKNIAEYINNMTPADKHSQTATDAES